MYARGAEIIETMLRLSASPAQVYRVTDHYGEQIAPSLYQPAPSEPVPDGEVVYAELDGSMVLTEESWREVKLGRVFGSETISESSGDRGQSIGRSSYTAHLGGHEEFCRRFAASTDRFAHLGERLVFLSDGARWIEQWVSERYPEATQILDYYHATEYLHGFARVAFSRSDERIAWTAAQKALLLAGRIGTVIRKIEALARSDRELDEAAGTITGYYRANEHRMQYGEYIRRGLYIGSGAIESAHRTVVQRRMKLSGQRWSLDGAERMLNLRVCSMGGNWELVRSVIRDRAKTSAQSAV